VSLGASDGKFVEIVSGLEPGAVYATAGSFVLKAEQGKGSAEHED
jgi:cobalt-zinc-cadmium efflux system membrane fusion protein